MQARRKKDVAMFWELSKSCLESYVHGKEKCCDALKAACLPWKISFNGLCHERKSTIHLFEKI